MNCPECGFSNYRVMDTINSADGKIYRRRKCLECGELFRTVEVMDDGSEEFKKNYFEAQQAKSSLLRIKKENKNGK